MSGKVAVEFDRQMKFLSKIFMTAAVGAILSMVLSGCLQTRDGQKDTEEKQVLRKQLGSLQNVAADTSARFQDLEDENRKLNGRIETLEAKLALLLGRQDKSNSGLEARLKEKDEVYREEFEKLTGEIGKLRSEVDQLREDDRRSAEPRGDGARGASAKDKDKDGDSKNPFAAGEEHFEQKRWKEAILSYEKYRSQNPKGKNFAVATYKIGLCFQSLGMADDAKAFFEEVVSKFPKSKEAMKAAQNLKKKRHHK